MFSFIFYFFSFLLSYFDCRRFIVPNVLLATCFILLLLFGLFEQQLNIYSFIVSILVLLFFTGLLLLKPTMILGGGDIKYMMLVAFYLQYTSFPIFLIVTGVLQTLALIYVQNIKVRRRKIVAMVPVMFASVIITEFIDYFGFNPLG